MTVKPCNRPAVVAYKLGQMEFIDVFCIHFNTYYSRSAVVQKQTLGEVETKTII